MKINKFICGIKDWSICADFCERMDQEKTKRTKTIDMLIVLLNCWIILITCYHKIFLYRSEIHEIILCTEFFSIDT